MTQAIEKANGHYAPDEPRARAIALVRQGYSQEYAGELVGVSQRTVGRWLQRLELSEETKPILERWHRVTLQAQDLIRDGLDTIEEDESGQSALKHLKELNFIAGTGTDKLQKESTPPAQNQTVVFLVNVEKPQEPVIEGEVVDG